MTSRSNPDWLAELIAEEGDAKLIGAQERDSLLDSIASAASPEGIDPGRHAQLLEAALNPAGNVDQLLDDPLTPPSTDEIIAAAATRKNLEAEPLVLLLRAAHAPSELSPASAQSVLNAALAKLTFPKRQHPRVSTFWGLLAVAAAAVLWVANATEPSVEGLAPAGRSQLEFAQSRTTGSLFSNARERSTASERIDRIAQVRQKDLRRNRYLLWGLP